LKEDKLLHKMALTKDFNPLAAVPSPRNVQKTKDALDKIKVDKLWVKYYSEGKAYSIMQNYFLEHEQYTHLVLCADDLIIQPEHFWALAKSVQSDPDKYQVFSGVCNLDIQNENAYQLAVCTKFPPCNPRRHSMGYGYAWIDVRGHNLGRKNVAQRQPCPVGINLVAFSGFPCMFIARPILERITLRTDYEYNLQYRLPGSSVDTVFCWDCYLNKIPIYADFDVCMLHLRGWADPSMTMLVGKQNPTVYLHNANDYITHIQTDQIVPIANK
jgi:hypothetical protein